MESFVLTIRIVHGELFHPFQWELPLAHCHTLLVADCYQSEFLDMEECPEQEEDIENFILNQAWKQLDAYTGLSLDGKVKIEPVDADLEAITFLDHAMFDRSEAAGFAGNSQWGLDIGMLEDNWNPYDLVAPE
ncbi:hypothetical protein GYMLUDRAFT_238970 [Collybiopsis luxurians FD-317 M1]|nr:hypothetical protein GYMLUDRAFT_238970 [Collybiopsis luxurians FD-317 M1]